MLVRKGGLEPPWVTPPDPKSGASANSATFAKVCQEMSFLAADYSHFGDICPRGQVDARAVSNRMGVLEAAEKVELTQFREGTALVVPLTR